MAGLDLTALLALDEAQKLIAGSDPYLTAKQAPDAIGQLVLGASKNPDYSTGELVASALVSGLLSGGLQGVSNDYQSRALGAYQDVLGSGTTVKPNVLNADVFNLAKNKRDVFALQLAQQEKILKDQATLDTVKNANDMLKAAMTADNPEIQDIALAAFKKQMGIKESPPPASGAGEKDATAIMDQITEEPSSEPSTQSRIEELARKHGSRSLAKQIVAAEEKDALKSPFSKLPGPLQGRFIGEAGTIAELETVASLFDKTTDTPGVFQAKAALSGTPENMAVSQLKLLIQPLIKLGGGAANSSDREVALALASTLGNISSGGPDVAQRVRNAAKMFSRISESSRQVAEREYSRRGDVALFKTEPTAGAAPPAAVPTPTPTPGQLTQELYEQLREAGLTKEQIKAQFAGG